MSEKGTLSTRQMKAITALLLGGTVRNAAKIARVSERQLYRWLAVPVFQAELDKAKQDAFESTVRALSGASLQAVLTLREITSNSSAKASDRNRAADALLAHRWRVHDAETIERRLAEIEAELLKLREREK